MRSLDATGRPRPAWIAAVLLLLALAAPAQPAPRTAAPIDVNSASLATLKTLPGVGDAEARRIVAHRPYLTKEAMVSSGAITRGTFVAIRRHVLVNPPGPGLGAAPAKAPAARRG